MLVCPLDYRYGRDEVKAIFSEESKLKYMIRVEISLLRAWANLGKVPERCVHMAEEQAENVSVERVKEIEGEIKHDVMALVKALAERCGDCGKYIHLGATSNDIIDTATALQFKEFLNYLEEDLRSLENTLAELADKHRRTMMLGRTHGQAAVPVTFGLKMANFLAEILRHHERLMEIKNRILVGKMMGAVGTGAAMGESAMDIQNMVMDNLGLIPEESPTQLVARDRYVEFISFLGAIATSMERFATEIRNLQRTEIGEVQEGFDIEKQVGSSTMAHKKNPITSENVCGLARIVRSMVISMHESAILWHERDLTNSSAERFIIPHACVITDDILVKMNHVFRNLIVNERRMMENIKAHEEVMAERVIMYLVHRGWGRQEAHEKLRQVSMLPGSFMENILRDEELGRIIGEDIDSVLNPESYIGVAEKIIDGILDKKRKLEKN